MTRLTIDQSIGFFYLFSDIDVAHFFKVFLNDFIPVAHILLEMSDNDENSRSASFGALGSLVKNPLLTTSSKRISELTFFFSYFVNIRSLKN